MKGDQGTQSVNLPRSQIGVRLTFDVAARPGHRAQWVTRLAVERIVAVEAQTV
jgi:hypothetical protein